MTKFRLFGRQTDEVSERELSHRQLAREVAAEGGYYGKKQFLHDLIY